ncbi:PREDICTED: RNA-binding protein 48 [Nicrophorus vespilloides]|uniref:RNA-binding protein 48 n=1 Tax=Nicrophorus vespilloides TaxID=110193 RepID=A0ABM1NHV3_NICVS|nr:PREDICTED: RNA-binding protein 48 [Nicrophorus vespilloides]
MEQSVCKKEIKHHKQLDLCKTRAAYRQGKKLTAVKVYTVSSESQHLFVYGVPVINLRSELKALFSRYGQVKSISLVSDHETEVFTECYHIQFDRIQSARIAKRFLDNKSFYGGLLHVCYAPEHEDIDETRAKLLQRNKDVLKRLHPTNDSVDSGWKHKRSHTAAAEDNDAINNDPMLSWLEAPKETNTKMLVQEAYIKYDDSTQPQRSNKKVKKSNLIPTPILMSKEFIQRKTVEKKILFYNK